ncbi:hypothetical protein TSAR_002535 [Trichomalopsis sarcophagae]|uniref:Uncharacterized protein n=1 Tax=Trichomalopsis sarcophagae TaxID=543379 RepID=A0A232FKR9_9HYME|nr:hypothetical protein TSAR_002535 [Trichomalopsis sarcophagae]
MPGGLDDAARWDMAAGTTPSLEYVDFGTDRCTERSVTKEEEKEETRIFSASEEITRARLWRQVTGSDKDICCFRLHRR